MKKNLLLTLAVATAASLPYSTASAQDNLLAEKPIYPLGEPKTWSVETDNGTVSETFNTDNLSKIVAVPTNTSNVFLYPENGTLNTPENQALGAQGFYVDMGTSTEVGTVYTTWEGAAADSYEIYLTESAPGIEILSTEPIYKAEGLGQYTENTAVLPAGAKGRYLVFQVLKATNWGWGVKIRSISAQAPADDVLTTFKVSPGIVVAGQETSVTLTILNQFGLAIPQQEVGITVSDNAVFENGKLTINSGTSATFTATLGGETITSTIYVATAPPVPAATSIKTPIYTNTVTEYNGTKEFTVAYNGGANNLGELVFADGEVAWQFGDTRCVFFSNSTTTGAWNGNINPAEHGYRNLCLDVFSAQSVEGTIEFESVENLAGGHTYTIELNAGEWTPVKVDVAGATKLGNLSIRFTEANMTDILLANIYFSPAYVDGDTEAPVLSEITAEPAMVSVNLSFSATDDKSSDIYYSITNGTKTYAVTGASGETVDYTFSGLEPSTEYTFTVTASDGLNISDPMSVTVSTTGLADAPVPSVDEDKVIAVYSNGYEATEIPSFDNWGSTATYSTIETENGEEALLFSNYMGQWGGLVNLDTDVEGTLKMHLDIYAFDSDGSLTVAPVWQGYNDTPNKTVALTANQWNAVDLPLSDFGFPQYGNIVIQLALTNSTLSSFAIGNFYFYGNETISGISSIENAESGEAVYYNLQGVKVANPGKGIYIRRCNGKTEKVVF